jgi:LacI family transcriptional regulator
MRDVAQAAGVSQSTVSLVLNGHSRALRISLETEARVHAVVEELGFRPNLAARGLRLQRTRTIGVLTDHIATSPFAGRLIAGAQEEAWANGHLLLLINTGGDPLIEAAAIDALLDRQVDGLLYAALAWRDVELPDTFYAAPSILVNCWARGDRPSPDFPESGLPAELDWTARDGPGRASVATAEVHGGRLAAQAVVDAGHREVGLLTGPADDPATIARAAGVREVLGAAGISLRPEWTTYSRQAEIINGYDAAGQVLGQPERPTAFICYNDRLAAGAILAAEHRGLFVPADLSVVGYDDQEDLAPHFPTRLTTVSLPHEELGRTGVRQLLTSLRSGEPAQSREVLGKLVARDSVSAPPSAAD